MDPPLNPRNHQIRHSGRALVRGKIRRVWRPRYLELWDNGVVRYYELPPLLPLASSLLTPIQSTSSAKDEDDLNKKLGEDIDDDDDDAALLLRRIPRYTLRVFSARILDATTLRDMHVGLPQGSFGFVFRGQRLMHLEDQSSEHGWNDVDEQEGGRTILGSSFGSSSPSTVPLSSLLMNPTQCTPQPQEQRDFLCAVSTLEEAQMWVIALQWAAQQSSLSIEPMAGVSDEPWWSVENEEWVGTTTPAMGVCASTHFINAGSTSKRDAGESSNAGVAVSPRPTPPPKPGKVVVARVVDYRLVRVSSGPPSGSTAQRSLVSVPFPWFGLRFDIAFEIHTLLIQDQVVEQLKLLRTSQDLSMLLQALPSSPPRLVRLCQQLPRNGQDLEKNVSIVDSIVRSLVLDAAIVNSSAMKQFLGLTAASGVEAIGLNIDSDPPFWFKHNNRAVLCRTTTELTKSPEEYVRRWLQERNHKHTKSDSWALRLYQQACSVRTSQLSQRQLVLTATALGLSAVVVPYCTVQVWRVMPRFSVRFDVLVGSWVTAAYLGRRYEQQQQASAPPKALSHRRLERRAHAEVLSASRHREDDTEGISADNLTTRGHDASQSTNDDDGDESDGEEPALDEDDDDKGSHQGRLSSPLPEYPSNQGQSCWSIPSSDIFYVRGPSYLEDKVKIPSDPGPLTCRGVDVWLTDNPVRHIARHPSVLGGKLKEQGTFLVNFLLPFGNFVSYFSIPPLHEFPSKLRAVWTSFLSGDQQYRDARLKLLPVVIDGPWIVKTAVGGGKSPALLGKVIPLQYYFRDPDEHSKGVYEVDVIITASKIAKGILSVVKGHTRSVSIAFALIIEASQADELPETVLCSFQVHSLHLEDCPRLPDCDLEDDPSL
jgi:Protein ENHANCED DISEASE RESISTANCE 2, C-terminal